jgi:hypothetical protein
LDPTRSGLEKAYTLSKPESMRLCPVEWANPLCFRMKLVCETNEQISRTLPPQKISRFTGLARPGSGVFVYTPANGTSVDSVEI